MFWIRGVIGAQVRAPLGRSHGHTIRSNECCKQRLALQTTASGKLIFDPDARCDAKSLAEPVLSARDVLAIIGSALTEADFDADHRNALRLEALEAVGQGRVGLAIYRTILAAAQSRSA
ncbi:MAG: hypothetical protein ACXIT4_04755 [Erythrobacter sp.]